MSQQKKRNEQQAWIKFCQQNHDHEQNSSRVLSVGGVALIYEQNRTENQNVRALLLRALPSLLIFIAQILEREKIGDKNVNVT